MKDRYSKRGFLRSGNHPEQCPTLYLPPRRPGATQPRAPSRRPKSCSSIAAGPTGSLYGIGMLWSQDAPPRTGLPFVRCSHRPYAPPSRLAAPLCGHVQQRARRPPAGDGDRQRLPVRASGRTPVGLRGQVEALHPVGEVGRPETRVGEPAVRPVSAAHTCAMLSSTQRKQERQ